MKQNKLILALLMLAWIISPAGAAITGSVVFSDSGPYVVKNFSDTIIKPDPIPPLRDSGSSLIMPRNIDFSQSVLDSSYQYLDVDGITNRYLYNIEGTGNVYVTVWDTSTSPRPIGSHYCSISTGTVYYPTGWASFAENMALSGSEAKSYHVAGTTNYIKRRPLAPGLTIEESQTRLGDTDQTKTRLKITLTADTVTDVGENIVYPSEYVIEIRKKSEETANDTLLSGDYSATAAFIDAPAQITSTTNVFLVEGDYLKADTEYTIKAWNNNEWTLEDTINSLAVTTQDWTILGATGGPTSATVTFSKKTGGFGINTISIPPAGVVATNADGSAKFYVIDRNGTTKNPATNALALVYYINAYLVSMPVRTLTYWDGNANTASSTFQSAIGVVIPTGKVSLTGTSDIEDKLKSILLLPGRSFYLAVDPSVLTEQPKSFTVTFAWDYVSQ